MAKLSPDITDYTLLCEQCGYVLEGLDPAANCPECGKAIAESLPSARTGSPFELSPDLCGFLRHCRMLVGRPKDLFRQMQVAESCEQLLCFNSLCLAAAFLVIPALLFVAIFSDSLERSAAALLMTIVLWLLALFVLMLLTWVERIGIVFFARKRGWRLPKPVASAICANASPGWIAAGTLTSVGIGFMTLIHRVRDDLPRTWWPWAEAAAAACPVLGFVVGMLIFETLVYIGVRRCRYANWVGQPEREAGKAQPSSASR